MSADAAREDAARFVADFAAEHDPSSTWTTAEVYDYCWPILSALLDALEAAEREGAENFAALMGEREKAVAAEARVVQLEAQLAEARRLIEGDPDLTARALASGLRKIVLEDEAQAHKILDWIGVAETDGVESMALVERVRLLAVEFATRQGYSLEDAERLAPPAFPAAVSVADSGPAPEPCPHPSASFDRTLCACGSMHDYCETCGKALDCPLDSGPEEKKP